MSRKQYLLFICLLLFCLLCAGCMSFENYHSDLTTSFEKSISKHFPNIRSFDVVYNSPAVRFYFDMTGNADSNTIKEIFIRTRTLFQSEEFQQAFFKQYFDKYQLDTPDVSKHYPIVSISFFLNENNVASYEYKSTPEEIIDPIEKTIKCNYEEWVLHNQDESIERITY